MFPQLIAGPIVRFSTVANDLRRRVIRLKHVYYGVLFFCVGLAEKVLLADTLAEVADGVYATSPTDLHASAALLGGLSYSFQIFFDFSGYSAMAIGLGLILGFKFPRNFNFPYISQSITEFWRRWHLSLSTWFRDYVYIPLGGNRKGLPKTYRNLMAIFLLTGIWHGASWNFIIWGLWHGLFMLIERLGFGKFLQRTWIGFRVFYTLLVAYIGWIFFRATDLHHAFEMIWQHFAFDPMKTTAWAFLDHEKMLVLAISFVVSTPMLMVASKALIAPPEYGAWSRKNAVWKYSLGIALAALLFCVSCMKVLSGAYSPFIYFRF
jgi:Predicted membrane protein involved in D-alanine export